MTRFFTIAFLARRTRCLATLRSWSTNLHVCGHSLRMLCDDLHMPFKERHFFRLSAYLLAVGDTMAIFLFFSRTLSWRSSFFASFFSCLISFAIFRNGTASFPFLAIFLTN